MPFPVLFLLIRSEGTWKEWQRHLQLRLSIDRRILLLDCLFLDLIRGWHSKLMIRVCSPDVVPETRKGQEKEKRLQSSWVTWLDWHFCHFMPVSEVSSSFFQSWLCSARLHFSCKKTWGLLSGLDDVGFRLLRWTTLMPSKRLSLPFHLHIKRQVSKQEKLMHCHDLNFSQFSHWCNMRYWRDAFIWLVNREPRKTSRTKAVVQQETSSREQHNFQDHNTKRV